MPDRAKIVQYLRDFQESKIPKLIKREMDFPGTKKIISIIGPRRSGKTFLFFQTIGSILENGIEKERIIYLNFEDTKLAGVKYTEIDDILKLQWELYPKIIGKEIYIFLDEPQNIPSWEKAVRSLHDKNIGRLFITGSSAKLLSREIATSLRGRTISYLLLPFSFKEFLSFKEFSIKNFPNFSSTEEAKLKSLLHEYLKYGGFPEVVSEAEESVKLKTLKEYQDLVLYRDIVERHGIKNLFVVKALINIMFSGFSKEMSVHSIFNSLKSQGIKISKKTLYNYVAYIEDAIAVFFVRKISASAKIKELSIPKVYLVDTGFANLVSGFSENIGRIMENAVLLELKRRQSLSPLTEIYYWKSQSGKEADFAVKNGTNVKEIIQVSYSTDDRETKDREVNALLSACKDIRVRNLTVITWDYDAHEKHSGKAIKFIPLWKWLLAE